jgi:26S proteasome regulatory subunit N8
MVESVFVNIPCKVSAYEAEEVGVEHLLREIKNLDINSLENKIKDKVASLTTL